jgi:hypothetical protein
MRIVRNLLAFAFIVVATATVAAAFLLYLAATGRNLPMLRTLVGALGRTMAGQRTESLALEIRLRPEARSLSANARLTVRATEADRTRLYFLLNEGLQLREVWEEQGDARTPLRTYRVWLLNVVELPRPLAADEQIHLGLAYDGQPRRGGVTAGGTVLEPDDVILPPADLWYPSDLQGFFDADVEVALPASLTLAHNAGNERRIDEGTTARVRWTTERPVGGLALVAGRYRGHTSERDGTRYQVLLPDGVQLDPERLLDALATAERGQREHYGPSGFSGVTLYVSRRLPRAFNDGTGLLGIPPRYFHDGDYGFETIAHEIAHNWWGGTVAERWLTPGSGGEWIVEGFAEFSGWRAVGAHLGEAALLRTLAANGFDPDRTSALQTMSVLDNGLDPNARATIYNKGGYVAFMLEQQLGAAAFDQAAQAFLEQFRHQQASAADVERVFAATTQQDLAPFFNAWVYGNESIDLALEPQEGAAVARNLRTAPAPPTLALWRVAADAEPEQMTTALGASTPLGTAERMILDPLALVADMFRSNNVLPRRNRPRAVARSVRDELMVVRGEPYAWEPATVEVLSPGGATLHSWVIDPGLVGTPAWSADGTRILAVESAGGGQQPTLLALQPSDGSRQSLGHDTAATGTPDATIVARGDRLLRIAGRVETTLAQHPGGRIASPLASPDATRVAYAVVWNSQMDLRVYTAESNDSRILFTWPSGPVRWSWTPDGRHLFVVLPGDWDWQLWELPLDGNAPRSLVREAAGLMDMAVAPDGGRIALVAQPTLDDAHARHELYVFDRTSSTARRFTLDGHTAWSVAWLDDESLLVVVSSTANPALPIATELRRLRLSDGTLEPFEKD